MNPLRVTITPDRAAWWDPASDFASRPGRQIHMRGRVFAVDPATTSPNVLVGIAPTANDTPVFLRPGESIAFPKDVYSVWIHNPQSALLSRLTGAVLGEKLLGTVNLISGTTADLAGWRARANRTRPTPAAALIAYGYLRAGGPFDVGGPDGVWVWSNGLEKIRIAAVPVDANGAPLAPPADLAATIKIYKPVAFPLGPTGGVLVTSGIRMTREDGTVANESSVGRVQYRDDGSDLAISQGQTIADLEVGSGSCVYLGVEGLAGTDVAALFAHVEGE